MPAFTLKRAGTQTAMWLSGPVGPGYRGTTLDQEAFNALPKGHALKAALTASYASHAAFGEALGRLGVSVWPCTFSGSTPSNCSWTYGLTEDSKPYITFVTDFYSVAGYVAVKLAATYSAAR